MGYKIVYIEDLDAASVLHDLSRCGLDVEHCKPTSFTETIADVDERNPDLILMDFRLMQGGGEVDAPAIAQYYRSRSIDAPKQSLPIVLLSNDQKIQGYYDDFTSHDLFDFSISKGYLSERKEKYSHLMKELIDSYGTISALQKNDKDLLELLNTPDSLQHDVDPRINEILSSKKYQSNIYMASSFILNSVVKPIGVLIGEDVLSARLGVSMTSVDWKELCKYFNEFEYKGLYSGAYRRWWSVGIDNWWLENVDSNNHLKRLNSAQKLQLLIHKYKGIQLDKVKGDTTSKTETFWSICQHSLIPIDPSEAFEIKSDLTLYPWLDSQYYSYTSIRDNDFNEYLTDLEKLRYKELAKRS
tara:strand:+ start:3078 stop:4148 length:1071 start_codon:yes stop_codon:yes gene_type:complete